jgi:hypothetical protein
MVARMIVVAMCAAVAGCGDAVSRLCDRPRTEQPVTFTQGTVEDGVYMSSDWDGELLAYRGGAYYRFEHRLGERPRWWQCYLSFERSGIASGSIALATGNQAELKAIDDKALTVLNGTCVDYWVLCTAGVGAQPPSP